MNLPDAPAGWLKGVDTSAAQGILDVAALQQAGVSFVIAKATEGLFYMDPQWLATAAACRASGILWGAYDVLDPNKDPAAQADHFAGIVQNSGASFAVLDFELAHGETGSAALHAAATWVLTMTARSPPVTTYTGPSFMEQLEKMAAGAADDALANLADTPLWVAHYGCPFGKPSVPTPWKKYTIWQAGPAGATLKPGVPVDMDYFQGSLDDLKQALGIQG